MALENTHTSLEKEIGDRMFSSVQEMENERPDVYIGTENNDVNSSDDRTCWYALDLDTNQLTVSNVCIPDVTPDSENLQDSKNQTTVTFENSEASEVISSHVINLMLLKDVLGMEENNLHIQNSSSVSNIYNVNIDSQNGNYSDIIAMAQANLVAQTQQDIAMQLMEHGEGHVNIVGQVVLSEQLSQGQIQSGNDLNKSPIESNSECAGINSVQDHGRCSARLENSTSRTSELWKLKDKKEQNENCGTLEFVTDLVPKHIHDMPAKDIIKVEKLRCDDKVHMSGNDFRKPNELKCDVEGCDRSFIYKAHLKYHKLTHSNDRKHICEVEGCGQAFFTSQRLKVHARTHNGTRPFTCKECNKAFTTAGNLKNHIRTHSGEKPFICNIEGCNKRFAECSTLQKHARTHTGEKPFKCSFCPKSFSQSSSRSQHMKKHLMTERENSTSEKKEGF